MFNDSVLNCEKNMFLIKYSKLVKKNIIKIYDHYSTEIWSSQLGVSRFVLDTMSGHIDFEKH